MKFFRLCFVFIILCSSCADDIDVYKTKSGLFASKAGRFSIKLPRKPNITTQENKLGNEKFNTISFRYRNGIEQFYGVSYTDYPETVWKVWNDRTEQLFDQSAALVVSEFNGVILEERQVDNDSRYDKSITYKLHSAPGSIKSRGVIRFIKKDSRMYYVYAIAARRLPSEKELDDFIDSFQAFDKPKEN